MKRQKNKRRKKTTKRPPVNLRSALDAHRKARVLHAAALRSHELFLEAHAAALDRVTEALCSRAITDPIVDQCIHAHSSGGPFDDSYRLDNIVGLRIDDLRGCLNDKLGLEGCPKRFGPISGNDTVGVLKGHANQRCRKCHGGDG